MVKVCRLDQVLSPIEDHLPEQLALPPVELSLDCSLSKDKAHIWGRRKREKFLSSSPSMHKFPLYPVCLKYFLLTSDSADPPNLYGAVHALQTMPLTVFTVRKHFSYPSIIKHETLQTMLLTVFTVRKHFSYPSIIKHWTVFDMRLFRLCYWQCSQWGNTSVIPLS